MVEIEKLDRIPHLEELPLLYGQPGLDEAFRILDGFSNGRMDFAVKVDGCPSLVFGENPYTGNFFVSTKSFFNKTSKYIERVSEIEIIFPKVSEDLKLCLKEAFQNLPYIFGSMSGFFQGDVLFYKDSKFIDTSSPDHISYQPNVVKYYTPTYSSYDRDVFGICVHTSYLQNLKDTWIPFNAYFENDSDFIFIPKINQTSFKEILKYPQSEYLAVYRAMKIGRLDAKIANRVIWYRNQLLRGSKMTWWEFLNEPPTPIIHGRPEDFEIKNTDYSEEVTLFLQIASILEYEKNRLTSKLDNYVRLPDLMVEDRHEGFVVNTNLPSRRVKLINRNYFTKSNFAKHNEMAIP